MKPQIIADGHRAPVDIGADEGYLPGPGDINGDGVLDSSDIDALYGVVWGRAGEDDFNSFWYGYQACHP